jgi:hypothetical protein
MTARARHEESTRRALKAAARFFRARKAGDRYAENIAYTDFKAAFEEAGLAFAEMSLEGVEQ